MGYAQKFRLTGMEDLRRAFASFKQSAFNKYVRRGLLKVGRRAAKHGKELLGKRGPYGVGLLRKRLKAWSKTTSKGVVLVFVGYHQKDGTEDIQIRDSQVFRVRKDKRIFRIRDPFANQLMARRNPGYYARLIEMGFTLASGRHVPGRGTLRKAIDAAKAYAPQMIEEELKKGFAELVAKHTGLKVIR